VTESTRPLRLVFDARYIRTDFHDGISRFSAELAHAVFVAARRSGSGEERPVEVAYLIHDDAQRSLLSEGARIVKIHAPTSWREPFSALILNRFRPDVLFSPMQTIGSLGRRFRLILTLHDTIYYRHRTPPRDLPAPVRLGWRLFHLSYAPQRLVLNRADVVATVSETSRRQFADVRLTKRPVVVLGNAPQRLGDLLTKEHVGPDLSDPPRHLIYMGSFMPYKNVETLVRGMRELPDHTLHLLSRISDSRREELRALGQGANIVFHNGVSDAEYASLLADRGVLVTLSLDEGYGLPIAEALALGVPAVVSDLEIFHEVAGGGALFVPAEDPAAFARAVRTLDDAEVRARLSSEGATHMQNYSWEQTAKTLLETARSL